MFTSLCIRFVIVASFLLVQALPPCPLVLSVDISNGTRLPNSSSILFDNLVFPVESQFSFENTNRACVCDIKPCIRKCCPKGESFFGEDCQTNPNAPSLQFHRHTEPIVNSTPDLYTIHNLECAESDQFWLFPNETEFFIQENGTMYLIGEETSMVPPDQFCYEYLDFEDTSGIFSALYCSLPSESSETFFESSEPSGYLNVTGMPFLLATFIVYALLPERNIHRKCLMSYVITLFGAYALLVAVQLNYKTIDYEVCRYVGLTCLYFFMVSFFWMNVISIDIWWTFSGIRGKLGGKRKSEQRKFLIYCVYSWGAPVLLVILVASLTLSKSIPLTAWYNPGMGEGQCWFKKGKSTFVFFYLPMSIIISSNMVFFLITAVKIKNIKRHTSSIFKKDESKKHTYESEKQILNLYLKLSLAMGVNWIMEIIARAIDWQVESTPKAIWYLPDFFNAVYGVFIFFIFVFKWSIWKMLKQRYNNFVKKPNGAEENFQVDYQSRTRGFSFNQTVHSNRTSYADDTSIALVSPVP